MKKKKYPLSIHITSLFLLMATVLGTGLIIISYYHSQELLYRIAKELSKENGSKLELLFQRQISPILTTLDFMATNTLPAQPSSPEDEPFWLKSIQQTFERNPQLIALLYGSSDGTSTQFRPMSNPGVRKRFAAPGYTHTMVNYTNLGGRNDYLFYDSQQNQIQKRLGSDNRYDPRTRPWYLNASPDEKISLTAPYEFYYLKVLGVTLSRLSTDRQSVVAADLTLEGLQQQLRAIAYSDNSRLALFDDKFTALATHRLEEANSSKGASAIDALFSTVTDRFSSNIIYDKVDYQGQTWSVTVTPVNLTQNIHLYLAEATPEADLLTDLLSMRDKQVIAAVLMLFFSFIFVWHVASRLSKPLLILDQLTENIRDFHFKKTRYPKSMIREVSSLTHSIEIMEHTLHDLLSLLRETASNHDFEQLTKTISKQSYLVTKAETIVLSVLDKSQHSFVSAVDHSIIPFKISINQLLDTTPWMRKQLTSGEVIHLRAGDIELKNFKDQFYNSEVYFFPLLSRNNTLVGILTVGYERPCEPAQKDKHVFLKELLSFAQIAKENIDQIQTQKQMFTSFIELIASAIDTKSPYTGGHCQRVPELATLLTRAASEDRKHFPEFSMDDKKWEELNIAAWLHDCGKITTPEYIVDKATKLETIYNRIHEVRMRFEVLKAQKETACWQRINKGADKQACLTQLQFEHTKLDEEFAFVASCNLGHKKLEQQDILRLQQIGGQTWTRTLNAHLGLSWLEKQQSRLSQDLPAQEPLLSDRSEHVVKWDDDANPIKLYEERFNLAPPEVKYNRGELYNLAIPAGTLNREERFAINEHIIQTITLLEKLPFPEHLQNVARIAGAHHERIDGKGYPIGLTIDELSVQERVMAIADIFEALTSSDRPYKKAHSINDALAIMTDLATTGHIDPRLYLLFLEHDIHSVYAELFLDSAPDCKDKKQHIRTIRDFIGE